MKKYLITLIAVLGLVFTTQAAELSVTSDTATTASLINGPFHLQSIEVINNAASTVIVKLYDTGTTNITWVSEASVSAQTYTTNLVTTTTNYNGIVTTRTNLVSFTVPVDVDAATNNFKLLRTLTIAAGQSATWEPINGVYPNFGLAASNDKTNTTFNVTFSSIR